MTETTIYSDADKSRAKELFMAGQSLRAIAKQVLPHSKGGFVTIQRWSTKRDPDSGMTWQEEREDLNAESRAAAREKYLSIVSQVKDDHLRVAAKGMLAVELALESYFLLDKAGNVVGIKKNMNGNPLISARDIAPLVTAMHTIQKETLRMDMVQDEEVAKNIAREAPVVVESTLDPAFVKQMADELALRTLVAGPVTPEYSDGEHE